MMSKFTLIKYLPLLAILYILHACSASDSKPLPSYELVPYSGDLMVEQFDSTVTRDDRFNLNNKIYTPGSSFTYSYQYTTKEGEPLNFEYLEEGWEFTTPGENDINEITLGVMPGLKPMIDWVPDYNQTLISYQPSNKESFEMTGLIENEANIWLHPPRDGLFRILQLSPYPSVKYPTEPGKEWEWSFRVGNGYADERWATWDGIITITTAYRITGKQSTETRWGDLETYTIEAEATSELGKSSLTAIFSDSLGFLEMNFINIDGSQMNFSLDDFSR